MKQYAMFNNIAPFNIISWFSVQLVSYYIMHIILSKTAKFLTKLWPICYFVGSKLSAETFILQL